MQTYRLSAANLCYSVRGTADGDLWILRLVPIWVSVLMIIVTPGGRVEAVQPGELPAQDEAHEDAFPVNGVTAHRGNSGDYPENTMVAFLSALDVGADWIELDVFRTSDGQLVVIHDRTTERTGDRNLVVADSAFAELQNVDVATDFRRRHGLTIQECPVRRIPLLKDILRLVIQQQQSRVSIQPKMDCVADAVKLVRTLKAEH